jgi:SPP1 gp7 family putative phage head morphogenesis protein
MVVLDVHHQGVRALIEEVKKGASGRMRGILSGLRRVKHWWANTLVSTAMPVVEDMYLKELASNVGVGVMSFDPLAPDVNALKLFADHPEGLVPSLRDFAEEQRQMVEAVVRASFDQGTFFDLPKVVDILECELKEERWKLERIVRTETRKFAGMGRIHAWEQDPRQDWYNYHYQATHDTRTRPEHMAFMQGGPYTFDAIKQIWEIDREPYNCRCAVTRTLKPHAQLLTEGLATPEEVEWLF